jgi:hypothetical protein
VETIGAPHSGWPAIGELGTSMINGKGKLSLTVQPAKDVPRGNAHFDKTLAQIAKPKPSHLHCRRLG